jgi:hypothetical protein
VKKVYEKPTLMRRERLSGVAAGAAPSYVPDQNGDSSD